MDPEIVIVARRGFGGQPEVLDEKTVQGYMDQLVKVRDGLLREAGWEFKCRYFYSEELLKTINEVYELEIKYCQFYLDYHKKRQDPNFNKWVFEEKKTEQRFSGDPVIVYDLWTLTNGKMRATIRIDNSTGKMTRIALRFANDNSILDFIGYSVANEQGVTLHAKTPEVIAEKVEALMKDAESILEAHLYPEWCQERQRFQKLQRFLCIPLTTEAPS